MSEEDQPQPKKGPLATVAFLLVLAAVIGTFWYLSKLDPPPDMPATPQHKLRFNTAGELVGLMTDPEAAAGPAPAAEAGLKLEKKEVERRINQTCQQCHGVYPGYTGPKQDQPPFDPQTHACASGAAPCLPLHHPPKLECIKCHRMPK